MNKELYDKEFIIQNPDTQNHIRSVVKKYNKDARILRNILENDFKVSYGVLKKLKNYFDTANDKQSNYESYGGDIIKNEVKRLLSLERDRLNTSKKNKSNAGLENQYAKPHQKFKTKAKKLDFRVKLMEGKKIKMEMVEDSSSKKEACVCVLLHEEDKKILLLKREPNDEWMGDKWSFVGGMLDEGESCDTAIKREIQEESGIDETQVTYCWTKETDSTDVHFYLGKTSQREVKLSDEHSEFLWATPEMITKIDVIPDTISDIKKTLEYFNKKRNISSLEEDSFDDVMDKSFKELLPHIEKEMPQITKKIGNKDGQLDSQVNEALIPMMAGAAMALPEIMKLVSKWGTKLGKEYDSKTVELVSKKIDNAAQKLHHKYESIMLKIIKPFTTKMNDEARKQLAKNILFSVIITLGISAITSSGIAFNKGDISTGAIESVLGGIKAKEVVGKIKMALPQIIAQNAS